MATQDATSPQTLKEWANRMAPGKKSLMKIVEALSQKNSILENIIWDEANNGTTNLITQRTYEPQGSERQINKGVPVTGSRTKTLSEGSCMLEDYSEIDEALLDLYADKPTARLNEDTAHMNGMKKLFAQRLFYGTGQGEQILGLANRFNLVDNVSCYDNSDGNGSVTANKTSLYIVQWSKDTCHLHFPQNTSDMGIQMNDMGKCPVEETVNNVRTLRQVWRTQFKLRFGLSVKDARAVMRLANISTSGIDSVDDFSANIDRLIDMLTFLEYSEGVRTEIYCNRTIMSQLRKHSKDKINTQLDPANPAGVPITTFDGIPIKRVDQIVNTEGLVLAA